MRWIEIEAEDSRFGSALPKRRLHDAPERMMDIAVPRKAVSPGLPRLRIGAPAGPLLTEASLMRALDVAGAALALLLFAPLLLLIAAAVKLEDGGPVFYAQQRLGRGGRNFGCLKFRSMAPDAAARLQALLESSAEARAEWGRDHKLKDDPRRTTVGVFLRRTSLDELPQLLNVLRGEMSLVGPRPIVAEEVVRYGRRYASYVRVRPGITGLWQVSGRNDTTYRRRVALDHTFVRRGGLRLYVWILLVTIPAVLLRRGSY